MESPPFTGMMYLIFFGKNEVSAGMQHADMRDSILIINIGNLFESKIFVKLPEVQLGTDLNLL